MARITEELIRKKSEHNDGLLGDLEEISLHQCELERIEVIGTLCRKLRILYLYNNIIPKLENLHHLKELRYLNIALNNITRIEGLQNCEFLEKLDMTLNFVGVDALADGVEHLSQLGRLEDVTFLGNPFTDWERHRDYLIARLPQLLSIDGKDVTRSERLSAQQRLSDLEAELAELAAAEAARKEEEARKKKEEADAKEAAASADSPSSGAGCDAGVGGAAGGASGEAEPRGKSAAVDEYEDGDVDGEVPSGGKYKAATYEEEEASPWCPEERVQMYREMAEQRREEEERERARQPKERDYGEEHRARMDALKEEEEEMARMGGKVRWRNEGKLGFKLEEEDGRGNIVLRLDLPRFLDSSLVDVEAHPHHVTVVAKGKLFRMAWPEEVSASEGQAERLPSGALVLTVPKAKRPSKSTRKAYLRAAREAREETARREEEEKWSKDERAGRRRRLRHGSGGSGSGSSDEEVGVGVGVGGGKLALEIMRAAAGEQEQTGAGTEEVAEQAEGEEKSGDEERMLGAGNSSRKHELAGTVSVAGIVTARDRRRMDRRAGRLPDEDDVTSDEDEDGDRVTPLQAAQEVLKVLDSRRLDGAETLDLASLRPGELEAKLGRAGAGGGRAGDAASVLSGLGSAAGSRLGGKNRGRKKTGKSAKSGAGGRPDAATIGTASVAGSSRRAGKGGKKGKKRVDGLVSGLMGQVRAMHG